MTLLLNKELQRIDYVTYHCNTINWDSFSILAFFFICMFGFMAILMTRSLGACWAPTSRPPARTPDPGFWYIHHHHNHNHHDHHHHQLIHPLLQEKYTGLETARLWNTFGWSRSSKYLPSTVKIWSHDPKFGSIVIKYTIFDTP